MSLVTCLGYNSLSNVQVDAGMDEDQLKSNKPAGKRVWTWLVLCDDGNVQMIGSILSAGFNVQQAL